MRKPRITWKRTNGAGQAESHCGRYWLVDLRGPWSAEDETDNFRLWHADTCVIVGHYVHKADAKVAAEKHLEGFADEVRQLRVFNSHCIPIPRHHHDLETQAEGESVWDWA